jgi:pre-rRNA-processing protein TSR2
LCKSRFACSDRAKHVDLDDGLEKWEEGKLEIRALALVASTPLRTKSLDLLLTFGSHQSHTPPIREYTNTLVLSTMESSSSTPSPNSVLFARGVLARLHTWPALTLAIAQGWGGAESSAKLPWLAGAVIDAFEDPPEEGIPDAEYLEAMLLQIMEDEFECTLEDGSAWDVAKDVVRYWDAIGRDAEEGRKAVETVEAKADKLKGKKVEAKRQGESDDDDTSGDEDEEMEDGEQPPQLLVVEHPPENTRTDPIVDEDGFTMVQNKSKRK